MKKKILFVINSMGCGGAEKSLLSLLSLLDYDRYDVTLQMFRRGGMFENLIPAEVKIREDLDYIKFCSKSPMEQMLSFDFKRVCARICTSLFLRKNAKDIHFMMHRHIGNTPAKRLTNWPNNMMLP